MGRKDFLLIFEGNLRLQADLFIFVRGLALLIILFKSLRMDFIILIVSYFIYTRKIRPLQTGMK
jgi:hypothetical protein